MTWIDWAIVAVLAVSIVNGVVQGFFRSICALGGLLVGLMLAASHYEGVATVLNRFIPSEAAADAVGFLLIAILVMFLANLVGIFLKKALKWMGLGCLDRLGGVLVGFLQGALMVTLCILATVAFFPHEHWLAQARLPKLFLGACHLSTHMTPAEMTGRIEDGLRQLEKALPEQLQPKNGVL
jgi:membrane protein required for colicin V production